MRICFINSEYAIPGKTYGGYGRLNRIIGRELVRRGFEVYVLIPRSVIKKSSIEIDGIKILTFNHLPPRILLEKRTFREADADVYETWDPYMSFSLFAMYFTLDKKHTLVFADPYDKQDFVFRLMADPRLSELRRTAKLKIPFPAYWWYLLTLRPKLAQFVISKADAYFCEAKFLIDKVKRMHKLNAKKLVFMPHAIEIPKDEPKKAEDPTVCFVGRWDVIKRVERFFKLAKEFPQITFIAIGRARDPQRDRRLREIGSKIPNLFMPGFVSESEKKEILEKSWILVNTSIHEGLPQTFIEACAYKCALLSSVNPDDFASKFGYHVKNDDFENGLMWLLNDDNWKIKGREGYEYVKRVNALERVIERRIAIYKALMDDDPRKVEEIAKSSVEEPL